MNMLWCELDRESATPLYEQLYLYIKNEIADGRLEYGTKLPSKRKLADFLKLSQNTVETAYDQLSAEGYVEVIPRKGFFVQAFEDLGYTTSNEPNVEVLQKKKDSIRFNFHPSHIDTKNFPFDKWRKYTKNTLDVHNHHLLLLGDNQGEYELRHEISQYLYHSRGVQCSPRQIIVGAGIEVLLQQLVLLFGEQKVYGVEDPGYHLMLKILKNYPHEVIPLNVDEEGVRVKEVIGSNINIVYATPSHHFPYGSVLSVNRRKRLLNWAEGDKERFIIEDDYDSEFRYTGKTIPSLHSMDFSEKVIYLGTFSKSLMPSVRISYMVLPKPLLQLYQNKFSFYHSTVSRIDQTVLTEFMKHGDFEKHLNRMRKIYRRKLEKVLSLLKPYEEGLTIIGERSGLHIVLIVKNGMNESTLVKKAADANLKVYPLSAYSMAIDDTSPPRILLGFAGIAEEDLELAVTTLLKTWGYQHK
ncbi:transcriptional regulator [Alkalihalobacillus alcalophilus ATCC 27647 = CGMCC 1.3604]|uniref:Transcriptional regulator n=1 Tax=Alkalihalobacillus alcalophilus ATCC 27647 = CGMCC 1.3604 TaxID=1218173 RepID=A0A094WJT9_ALKAL|nr:PLP-dependent aminotransferase family protein [Alkalihalobacillus alcalophilus]KGA96198.1 GntR family transcriptional regulator [Alkalihalobacillus alcalophilus ATCC 27647 = CGMCC 1.3604]MED1563021.1 PLP-dependent aminotransferase family protein [Alkalihalobacillus alcalophilus]THG89456.1 transcriptional regulator [Alkalihalobacillus alcalophilus ATCC 27647 = CGMCC 1.3604]